jgi:hypothetical protein
MSEQVSLREESEMNVWDDSPEWDEREWYLNYEPDDDYDDDFALDQAEAAGIDREAAWEALHENDIPDLPEPSFLIEDDALYEALSDDWEDWE